MISRGYPTLDSPFSVSEAEALWGSGRRAGLVDAHLRNAILYWAGYQTSSFIQKRLLFLAPISVPTSLCV
jgi:hypothetical protein